MTAPIIGDLLLSAKFAPALIPYTPDRLQADLSDGVASILAGVGADYLLDVNTAINAVVIKHKNAVYNGTASSPAAGLTAIALTANGLAMGYNDPVTGAWKSAISISAAGNVSILGTLKAASIIEAGAAVQGTGKTLGNVTSDTATALSNSSTALSNANAALSAIPGLLSKTAANILTGTITPQDSGGLKVGSITWSSSTGALTGGSGIAITEAGIIGAKSGIATFAIGADGTATFGGDINTSGDGRFSGRSGATVTALIGSGLYNVDYSAFAEAITSPLNTGNIRAGFFGYANSTGAAFNVGVLGTAAAGQAIGVVGSSSSYVGGHFSSSSGIGIVAYSATGTALSVNGQMAITSKERVANLNADYLDGYHAGAFSQVGHTHALSEISDSSTYYKFQFSADGVSWNNIYLRKINW